MVRRLTRLALVALAILVATGPSAPIVAGVQAGTAASATDLGGSHSATETVALPSAEATLNETTDDAINETEGTVDGTGDGTPNETDGALNETTAETTNETAGETTNETAGETTGGTLDATAHEAPNETRETANETANEPHETTDATDANEAGDEATANATAAVGGTAAGASGNAAGATTVPDSNASEATADTANAADPTTPTRSATGFTDRTEFAALPDATGDGLRFHSATSSTLFADGADTGTALDAERGDDESTFGDEMHSDEASTSGGETDSGASDSTARGGDETTATDAGGSDRRETGAHSDASDRSPDRGLPGSLPSGAEAVVGVGALTTTALFPHLADAVVFVGDVSGLSAASSAAATSRSAGAARSEFEGLWRTATAFRYSRYDDSDPLAHETRSKLHETVERSPGAYLSAVCDRADVAVSTGRHHLDVLEDEGLVATAKVRGKRRYFPARSDDVELVAALEDEAAAEVLRALARLGDSHGGRLADELDRDPSTVSHHLSRLEDAGLVQREREGRAVVNRLAPAAERALGDEAIGGDGDADAEPPAVAD